MNLAGFEKIALYLISPLMLYYYFGLLILGVLLKYGESKGRLPHLIFFLILLAMGVVIFLGKEDKTIWIPAAITMLGVAAPAALAWKSSTAGANAAVPFDAGRMAEQLYAQLDKKDEQLAAKDEQIKALTEALAALPQADAPPQKIDEALRALEQGKTEQAKAIFTVVAATKEVAGKKNNAEAAEAYRHLGALAYMNNPKEALLAYQKAVELNPDNAEDWNWFGNLLHRTGKIAQAEDAYRKVLALSKVHKDKAEQAAALGNLGIVYDTRGELDKAEEMYRKSLEVEEALGRKEGMAAQYSNLGVVYKARGDLDKAEEMLKKALALNEALDRTEGMVVAYSNLGRVYAQRENLYKAEEMYKKALALNEALDCTEGMADDYLGLSIVYAQRDKLAQTEVFLQKSLSLFKAIGHHKTNEVQQLLDELAQHRADQQAPSTDNLQ